MIFCLKVYFRGKTRYTKYREYQKYTKWQENYTDPSYRITYKFIKYNTTLVDDKKILFTLTKEKQFYRFKDEYLAEILNEKGAPMTTDETPKNQGQISTQPETIPTQISVQQPTQNNPREDEISLSTPSTTAPNVTANPQPAPADISRNLQLDFENATTTSVTLPQAQLDTITTQINELKQKLQSITNETKISLSELEDSTRKNVSDLESEIKQRTATTELQYTNATNKLKAKTFFLTKELEKIELKMKETNKNVEEIISNKWKLTWRHIP